MNRELAVERPDWLFAVGPYSETVICSGVEIARSFATGKFWWKAGLARIGQKKAVKKAFGIILGQDPRTLELRGHLRGIIWEKYPFLRGTTTLISPGNGLHIGLGPNEAVRLYSYSGGVLSESALARAMRLTESAGQVLDFAYDREMGFLNPNLEEVGSGLRFKAILHLPAAVHAGTLSGFREKLSDLGVKAEGFLKGWPKPAGSLVVITYWPGPDLRPHEAHLAFREIMRFGVEWEAESRSLLLSYANLAVEDRAARSMATLRVARLLGYGELADLLSWVRLGVGIGALEPVPVKEMTALLFISGRNHMRAVAGRELTETEENAMRASLVRATVGGWGEC
ncbi:MAG: hypothetical protein ABIM88_04140 [candidate division WOR-3 bacterium]